MSVDELIDRFAQLSRADIRAALAYYWDHRDEIERQRTEDDAFVEKLRALEPSELAGKLARLRREPSPCSDIERQIEFF